MGKKFVPPTLREDLKAGVVFRYTDGYPRKTVFYVGPRHMLMPSLVKGERPQLSTSPITGAEVQILWTPPELNLSSGDGD